MRLMEDEGEEEETCNLLDRFGIFVQFILGALSFSTLIVKRYRERPQRTWKIWSMDSSKQGFGSLVAHLSNMALSEILISGEGKDSSNPCVWYFLNIVLDTTVGVFITYNILRLLTKALSSCGKMQAVAKTGDYGSPPSWGIWGAQLVVWMSVIIMMKICIATILELLSSPLVWLASLVLSPIRHNPHAQLVIVMLFAPLCMNALQFWVQDNFLKKPDLSEGDSNYTVLLSEFNVPLSRQEEEELGGSTGTINFPQGSFRNSNIHQLEGGGGVEMQQRQLSVVSGGGGGPYFGRFRSGSGYQEVNSGSDGRDGSGHDVDDDQYL